MITKEQAIKASAAILSTFETYGVKAVEGKLYPFELKTDYGRLFITPRIDAGDHIASVFMRFDVLNWDKKALEKQLGKKAFNPFTGKWNIHCDNPLGIVEAFELNMMLLDIKPNSFNDSEAM